MEELLICKCGWHRKVEDQDTLGSECGCCPDCGNEDLIWLNELQDRIKKLEADNWWLQEYKKYVEDEINRDSMPMEFQMWKKAVYELAKKLKQALKG